MSIFQRARAFATCHERPLSVLSMAVGFFLDNTLLWRADLSPAILLLYSYLAASGIFILAMHLAEEGVWRGKSAALLRPWLPIALQFVSGATFSAFFVFYSRSTSILFIWPFLAMLLAIFAGMEIFHTYHDRLAFQNVVYFLALFLFSIYAVPLAVGRIGADVFLLSGAVAVLAFSVFLALLVVTGRRRFAVNAKKIFIGAGGVLILMNTFYFTHLLPPLPLSLRDIGVYHSIVKTNDGYAVSGEEESWLSAFLGRSIAHILPGEPAYVFSSVFTPVAIKTDIVHRWERWDTLQNKWILNNVVEFPVLGGRDGGYRGFSEISSIPAGLWRVSVETPDGRLIGRVEFTVDYVSEEPPLVNQVL